MATAGRSIRLFLVDGSPSGVLTAEIMNWTGHILYGPRTRLKDLLDRDELARTGVYLLVGKDSNLSPAPQVYVGETDNVKSRLLQHNKDTSKDFWEYTCIVTSKDQNLTKAHVRYLESQLISIIQREARATLLNGTAPDFDYLPEADIADMDYFLEQLRVALPSIGLDFLRETPKRVEFQPQLETSDVLSDEKRATSLRLVQRNIQSNLRTRPTLDGASSPVFEIKRPNLEAAAMELEGSFVVLKGSEARKDTRPSIGSNVKSTREQLLHAGKLAPSKKVTFGSFKKILHSAAQVPHHKPFMGQAEMVELIGSYKVPIRPMRAGKKSNFRIFK
ncbi:hypothetical protein SAMN04488518_110195 [Pseudovibrio ascidiaceicola]|uniref:GIY-YIG domain-containing protein n=1 Tax=Pseudovibrio ascidiaceicola TaxID=285279 RepID=A0A1I4D636_9HYPH|nr:GIY-YIG nuclease family protein [Pseudovibrio ascidiaceicola]SFK87616.1 hypothetical protein SAMN04488518_110195 [Pseudovibrio ascidiaceicola]